MVGERGGEENSKGQGGVTCTCTCFSEQQAENRNEVRYAN